MATSPSRDGQHASISIRVCHNPSLILQFYKFKKSDLTKIALEARVLNFVDQRMVRRKKYYFSLSLLYSTIRTCRHKRNGIWSYDGDFTEVQS